MGRRYRNPKRAKAVRCYTVEQIATLYRCHKNTVRAWLRAGLEAIDNRRPLLVRGSALNAFHASRRAKAKRPCGPGQIYCLKCGPQPPAGDMAEYEATTDAWGTLTAICPDCDRLIYQRVNAKRLAVFRALTTVTDVKP